MTLDCAMAAKSFDSLEAAKLYIRSFGGCHVLYASPNFVHASYAQAHYNLSERLHNICLHTKGLDLDEETDKDNNDRFAVCAPYLVPPSSIVDDALSNEIQSFVAHIAETQSCRDYTFVTRRLQATIDNGGTQYQESHESCSMHVIQCNTVIRKQYDPEDWKFARCWNCSSTINLALVDDTGICPICKLTGPPLQSLPCNELLYDDCDEASSLSRKIIESPRQDMRKSLQELFLTRSLYSKKRESKLNAVRKSTNLYLSKKMTLLNSLKTNLDIPRRWMVIVK